MTTPIIIDKPYLSVKEYAKKFGTTENAVRKRIAKGRIPSMRQGRLLYINMALLTKEALEAGDYSKRRKRR